MRSAPIVAKTELQSPTPSDVARLTELSRRCTGIELGSERTEFIRSRLDQRVKASGLQSYSEYCSLLERPDALAEKDAFREALTTNTTHFFREAGHYDWLRDTGVKSLVENGAGRSWDFTIWSAACSSGQELYSALMTVAAHTKLDPIRFRGIGTDISTEVLNVARRAVYNKSEILKIPDEYRPDYLLSSKASNDLYRIAPTLREKAEWREANLIDRTTIEGFQADVIFLRNVLIYFSGKTQETVLDNVLSKLRCGGVLLTGHTETGSLRLKDLRSIQPTIYQKVK